jgi:hypothetical protein
MVVFVVVMFAATTALGFSMVRARHARAKERVAQAAGRLGLRVLEGAEAMEQAALDAEADGRPAARVPASLPPFLARAVEMLVGPRLAGTYRGVRVAAFEESRSGSKGNSTSTVLRAWYPTPLPFDLHMAKEGVGARIAKAFGGQDVEIGEPAFDAAVRVRSSDPAAVKAWFGSPTRRQATVAAVAACPGLRASRTSVTFERQGSLRGADEIAAVLDAIAPLAAALGGR